MINGEKAAFNTPTFAQKRERTLDMLIKDLFSEHMNEGRGVSRYFIIKSWMTGWSDYFGFPLSVSFHQCFILIFIVVLLWSEGELCKAWEPSNKGMCVSWFLDLCTMLWSEFTNDVSELPSLVKWWYPQVVLKCRQYTGFTYRTKTQKPGKSIYFMVKA